MTINRITDVWYGEYGGCFLADAFAVSCDKLYEEYIGVVRESSFIEKFEKLVSFFRGKEDENKVLVFDEKRLTANIVELNIYPIIGQALVAKMLDKKLITCGVRYADEAIMIARVCAYLDLPLKLFLSLDISNIGTVINYLSALGVQTETHLCEIIDMPEMYAFQEWVADPENIMCIYCRSNVGAFPATNITTDFSSMYGDEILNKYEKTGRIPKRIIIPCITGTTALSILKPVVSREIDFLTVEIENKKMIEENDSYCGTFTKVMRDSKTDRVISPELANYWDRGIVKRTIVSKEDTIKELCQLNKMGVFVSMESAAAIFKARSIADDDTLVIVGEQRVGAAQ